MTTTERPCCTLQIARESRDEVDFLVVNLQGQCKERFDRDVKLRHMMQSVVEAEYIDEHTIRVLIAQTHRCDIDREVIIAIGERIAKLMLPTEANARVSVLVPGSRESLRVLALASQLASA